MSIEAMKQTFDFLHDLWEMKQTARSDQHKKVMWELDRAIGKAEKQEPVAYMDDKGYICNHTTNPERWTPLYTAPPQREWVGLTDEEILNLYTGITKGAWDCIMYARVIEARLKGMNHEPKPNKDLCGND